MKNNDNIILENIFILKDQLLVLKLEGFDITSLDLVYYLYHFEHLKSLDLSSSKVLHNCERKYDMKLLPKKIDDLGIKLTGYNYKEILVLLELIKPTTLAFEPSNLNKSIIRYLVRSKEFREASCLKLNFNNKTFSYIHTELNFFILELIKKR